MIAPPISRYRWTILFVCWLAYVVAFLQRLSIGPLAPFLKTDLNLTNAEVGLLFAAVSLGYTITLIPAGWLVDRIGVRWLFLIGEIIGGIFIGLMFTATSFSSAMVFMLVAGTGLGFVMPTSTKAVLVWFPLNERATAMGLKQTAINIGGIFTAAALPAIAMALSWRFGFVTIGVAAIVIGVVSFILYREPQKAAPSDPLQGASSPQKLSPWHVFKSRDIWFVSLSGASLSVAEFSVVTYFVLYLSESLLLAVVTAGFFLALLQAGGGFGKLASGLISDRFLHGGRKAVYLSMCGACVLLFLALAYLKQGSLDWLIAPLAFVLGLMVIGWGGLFLTLVGEIAGKELAGTVTGISMFILMSGAIAGPPLFGYIIDTTSSYRIAWQVMALFSALAVILLFFVREGKRKI